MTKHIPKHYASSFRYPRFIAHTLQTTVVRRVGVRHLGPVILATIFIATLPATWPFLLLWGVYEVTIGRRRRATRRAIREALVFDEHLTEVRKAVRA